MIFVVAMSKEGLVCTSPAKPSFGLTPTLKYNVKKTELWFYSRCRYDEKYLKTFLRDIAQVSFINVTEPKSFENLFLHTYL